MKVGKWSTTAGNNNSTPPDGWPEGQAPSTVNDCARENMAALKTALQDIDFFDHDFTPTFVNSTSFTVTGDQTSRLNVGRKLKLFDATTHIRAIEAVSYTTVTTVSLGAGLALTSSLSSFAVSTINPSNSNVPDINSEYILSQNRPSFLTTTTFSLGSSDATNFEVGRRIKLFDASTLYGTIISVSATQVQVRLDSGALTSSLSSVALSVIKATNSSVPYNVWARRNVIINSCMDFWQRSVSFQLAVGQTYTADRWLFNISTGAALTVAQAQRSATSTNVPTIAQAGILFNHSLRVSVSAADATIAAGEYINMEYYVEGYDWRSIAHKPLNLSFWVNTNKSGIYAASICNGGSDRTFVQNYTVSSVNTWSRISLQFPEAPTTGTWDYSTGVGLRIRFCLATGTTYQGGAGNWTAANILATSSQVNFASSAGNIYMITGIQLEEGFFATPLEIKCIADEYIRCQRYFERIGITPQPATPLYTQYFFKTTKRATPTTSAHSGTPPAGFLAGLGPDPTNSFRSEAAISGPAADVTFSIKAELS